MAGKRWPAMRNSLIFLVPILLLAAIQSNSALLYNYRPLMVACANATYKYEALYALLERLKNSPNAEKMFTAVNHENKVSIGLSDVSVLFQADRFTSEILIVD